MYRKLEFSLALVLALSGCSRPNESAQDPQTAKAAPDSASAPAVDHSMHATQNSPAGDAAATPTVAAAAGTNHGATHGAATSRPSDHSMGNMDHSGMAAAPASGQAAGAMDHSRMNMGQNRSGGAVAGSGATAGMDHNQMNHGAPAGRQGSTRAADHSAMQHGGTGATSRSRASGQAADHSRMGHAAAGSSRDARAVDHGSMPGMQHAASGAPQAARPAGAEGMRHDQTGMHGMAHGQASPVLPAGPGTDKLLALVRALVRDSVVQEQIQQDPALRERWEDPGVRRIVTSRP